VYVVIHAPPLIFSIFLLQWNFMIRLFFFSLYFWIWYENISFEYFRPHRVLFKNWFHFLCIKFPQVLCILYIDSPIFSNWTGRIGAPEGQITLWHISTKSNFSPAGIYEHMMIEKCWEKTCSRWGKCRTLGLRIVQKIYPCSYSEGKIRNANSKYISQICKSSYPWVRSDFVCMVWRCLLFCKRRRASGLFFFTISS